MPMLMLLFHTIHRYVLSLALWQRAGVWSVYHSERSTKGCVSPPTGRSCCRVESACHSFSSFLTACTTTIRLPHAYQLSLPKHTLIVIPGAGDSSKQCGYTSAQLRPHCTLRVRKSELVCPVQLYTSFVQLYSFLSQSHISANRNLAPPFYYGSATLALHTTPESQSLLNKLSRELACRPKLREIFFSRSNKVCRLLSFMGFQV